MGKVKKVEAKVDSEPVSTGVKIEKDYFEKNEKMF